MSAKKDGSGIEWLYDKWLVVFLLAGVGSFFIYAAITPVAVVGRAHYQEIFETTKVFCIIFGGLAFFLAGRGARRLAKLSFRLGFLLLGFLIVNAIHLLG